MNGWAFLIARGRREGYRSLLVPDFLARSNEIGVLGQTAGDAPTDGSPRISAAVYHAGKLTLAYRTQRLTTADLHATPPRADDSPPVDQFGRPLDLLYGFVCRDAEINQIDEADLDIARTEALRTYRRFLAAESDFTPETSTPFLLTSLTIPSTPATTAAPEPAVRHLPAQPEHARASGKAGGRSTTPPAAASVSEPAADLGAAATTVPAPDLGAAATGVPVPDLGAATTVPAPPLDPTAATDSTIAAGSTAAHDPAPTHSSTPAHGSAPARGSAAAHRSTPGSGSTAARGLIRRSADGIQQIGSADGDAWTVVPRRRSRWPVMLAAAVAVVSVTIWIAVSGEDSGEVTKVEFSKLKTTIVDCTKPLLIEATVQTDDAATVRYRWKAPDGTESKATELDFSKAAGQQVSTKVDLEGLRGEEIDLTQTLIIDKPNPVRASHDYTLTCR